MADLLREAGVASVPKAKVAVFVGNAWDPQPGRETPWIDIARQLAGDKGVEALGPAAKTTPPGTEAIARVFEAAGAPVLLLFDEVLNFLNRHRGMAESFHAFIQNLTVATTGTTHGAAVISLPRSQVEMTDWDMEWQEKISQGRAARRQGPDRQRRDRDQRGRPAAALRGPGKREDPEERRQGLRRLVLRAAGAAPAGVDGGGHGRDRGQGARVPAAPLRGLLPVPSGDALGLPAQVAGAAAVPADARHAGDAGAVDLDRGAGRLPQGAHRAADHARLGAARRARVPQRGAGPARRVAPRRRDRHRHRRRAGARKALDADTKGPLRDIHRRVGTAILFESSGGQTDKVAHLPELRFALGEPELDTTSIDNAAFALEDRSYFIRKAGSDGFRIGYQPTMKKVVSDRRASLDEETEVKPALRKLVEEEFRRGASIPVVPFPRDGAEIPDTPRLTLVVADPEVEWSGGGSLRAQIAEWTRQRGKSPRLYPGALVWCLKKPGRDLREKVELWLAWKRVAREVADGTLGGEFDKSDRAELQSKVKDAEEAAKDEVWGDYRFAVLADGQETDGLKVIDLGAGHSSSGETLCGRVIARAQVRGAAQRIRRRRLHRAQLAAGAQGVRGVAAREPAAELPQRLADAPRRSRRDPAEPRSSSSSAGATSAWRRAGSPTAATSGCGSRSWSRRTRSPSTPACSC